MVLDSIGALQAGFEGCEKKLEVDFDGADLRTLPQSAWVSILEKAQCTIITRAENDHFISFVLSESSLFVFPHKVILKTCGTTSLLFGLPQLLEVAEGHGAKPNFVQFSRSNFMFPEQQPFPHKSFDSEVRYLNKFLHGQPYILGPLDGPRWNLYIADFDTSVNLSKDQTLEVIMFNLDPEKMKPFYRLDDEKGIEADENLKHNGRTSTQISGIDQLIEGATIDSHLFSPCGYSCNGLKDEAYFTIHVTPEPECSFVSFETNVRMTDYTKLVRKVLDTFSPAAFSVYLFVDNESVPQNSHTSLNWDIHGFTRTGHTYHDFEGMYNLSVGNYTIAPEIKGDPSDASATSSRPPQYGSVALEGVPRATLDTIERLEASAAEAEATRCCRRNDSESDLDEYDAKFQCDTTDLDIAVALPKALSDIDCDVEGESSDGESVSSCASQNPESSKSVSPPSTPTARGPLESDVMLDYATSCALGAEELTSVVLSAVQNQTPVHSFDASQRADFGTVANSIIDRTDTSRAFFVVDMSALVGRFVAWAHAMPRVRPFYGIQCNSDPALILAMNALGCGFSGPSMRQIDTLLSLGVKPSDVLLSNPWPSISSLRLARERNIGFLSFDNKLELEKISVHCPNAQLFVMVSPQTTHSRHSTASRARTRPAYGTSPANAFRLLKQSKHLPGGDVVGVMLSLHDDCSPEDVRVAIESVSPLFERARRDLGINLRYLHLGSKGWSQRGADEDVAGVPSSPSRMSDVITPALSRHFPTSTSTLPLSRTVDILAEPSSFLVESAYTIVVSLLSIRSEAVPLDDEQHALKTTSETYLSGDTTTSSSTLSCSLSASAGNSCSTTPPSSNIVDYKLYFDYYVDDGIYRSFPFLKRRRAELVPHVVRRPLSGGSPLPDDADAQHHHDLESCLPMSTPTPSTLTLPNPDTGAQQVASSSSASSSSASSLVPSRSASPQPPHHAQQDEQQHAHAHRTRHRIVDALGAPVVASSSASASPDSECERLFQSRIWGATCDGLDSICDSVLLPKLNPDDRLFFRDMGANTFAHATAFNGFGDLPPPHYVVFK